MIINDLFESSYAGNTERAVARNMTLDTDQLEVEEGLGDYVGRKLQVKTTKGKPDPKNAPQWATALGQTPQGAWHWLEKDGPTETPDSDRYFPLSGKTGFTGFVSEYEGQQGVAEGSDGAVSFREMIDVVDQHYPKYYAELSGSDISDKQFERAIVNAYKEIIKKQGVAEEQLEEYGDTAKGQKMLTKVQKRAVDRVIKADDKNRLEPDYTKRDLKTVRKNQATADRAWDRMSDLDEQGVEEGYDKWGWHTSVVNGEFMPTKYGNKAYVYLHDMDNQSANGNPQLVTFNKPAHAKKAAAQFGGKVVKTDLNTYRVVKPAEQGVTESINAMIKQATSREDLRQIRKFVAENVADQKAQRQIMEQATHIVAVQRRKHAAQAAK